MATSEKQTLMSRRRFIAVLTTAAGGSILAACAQPVTPTPIPPKPAAATPAPAAPKPTASATVAPSPTSVPTVAPKPQATATAAAQPAAKKTITFWQEAGTPTANQGWELLGKGFATAQPNIEVKRVFQTGMSDIIKVALASDTGPDVFQRDIPPSYQQPLVDAKLVRAMDDYYKTLPNLQKVFPWARKRGMIAGKTWGVPHEVEFIPVFYNKGVFSKLGITELPTKSYDDFLALCKTIKDKGVQPLGLAGRARTQPGHIYSLLSMLTVGKEGFEDILYGEGRWDQEGMVESATRLRQLLDLGYLPKDVVAQEGAAVQAAFAAGRYAMWTTGTWSLMGFEDSRKSNADFDYDYFLLAPINPKLKPPQVAGGIGGGFSIASRAKDPEACALWIDFLMGQEAQRIWNEIFFQVAPTPFDPAVAKLPETARKAFGLIAKGEEMGYNISVVIPSNVVEIYWNGLGGILTGQLTPKEWAGKVQVEWEKAKAEGKVLKP